MRQTVADLIRLDASGMHLTAREWDQCARRAQAKTHEFRGWFDHRRFIRRAIDLDARSGWALQAYAEHGRASDLAAALQVNRDLCAVLVAQARLAGLHDLAQVYATRAETGA